MRGLRRSRAIRAGCCLVAASLLAPAAHAGSGQEQMPAVVGASPIAVGSRIRLEAPGAVEGRVSGRVVEMDERRLVLSIDDRFRLDVPREAITKAEVFVGRRSSARRGALIGAGLGLLAAAAVANAGCEVGFAGSSSSGGSTGDCLGLGALYVAMYAGVGALLGHAIKRDDWKPVSPPALDVAVAPTRGRGVSLAVRLSF